MNLTVTQLIEYKRYLENEEKSPATVEKYLRDVRAFMNFLGENEIEKEKVIAYKKHLNEKKYADTSINSMLASVNSFLSYIGYDDARVKGLKIQHQIYSDVDEELTKEEYEQLVKTAEACGKMRLSLVIQSICSTGIRVSELTYFTVEAIHEGEVRICCKNKNRRILIPKDLKRKLLKYIKKERIKTGIIFRTRTGRPLNRKNIWAEMQVLCKKAGVEQKKVFPHNLRKLFARVFHKKNPNIVKLADVLGHSSINTTRLYVRSTGKEHQKQIDDLGLVI